MRDRSLHEPLAFDPAVFHARLGRVGQLWAPVLHRSKVDSTQTLLRRQFAEHPGMPGFWRVAVADVQTDGRGRTGARWLAEPSAALLMTVGAALSASPTLLPRASLVAGLAVAEVLGPQVRVKWPNDLMVQTPDGWRKLGGILCERVGGACGDTVWLCGVGLNLHDIPSGMGRVAASLADLGCARDVSELAADLCLAIRGEIETWLGQHGRLDVLRLDDRLAFRGAPIEVDLGPQQGRRRGRLQGLDITGALRLETDAGDETLQPLCITASAGQPPWP